MEKRNMDVICFNKLCVMLVALVVAISVVACGGGSSGDSGGGDDTGKSQDDGNNTHEVTQDPEDYNGFWDGTTDQGLFVFFTVENNEVKDFSIRWYLEGNSCQAEIPNRYPLSYSITGDQFSINENNESYTGTFSNYTESKGTWNATYKTLNPMGSTSYCTASGSGTWTATKQKLKWFNDADEDGYGDPTDIIEAYTQPGGYVNDNTDCDDSDASINPGVADQEKNCPCTDSDGDSYFVESSCGPTTDCDDENKDIYPGAPEICDDAIDQDCNGADLLCSEYEMNNSLVLSGEPIGDGTVDISELRKEINVIITEPDTDFSIEKAYETRISNNSEFAYWIIPFVNTGNQACYFIQLNNIQYLDKDNQIITTSDYAFVKGGVCQVFDSLFTDTYLKTGQRGYATGIESDLYSRLACIRIENITKSSDEVDTPLAIVLPDSYQVSNSLGYFESLNVTIKNVGTQKAEITGTSTYFLLDSDELFLGFGFLEKGTNWNGEIGPGQTGLISDDAIIYSGTSEKIRVFVDFDPLTSSSLPSVQVQQISSHTSSDLSSGSVLSPDEYRKKMHDAYIQKQKEKIEQYQRENHEE